MRRWILIPLAMWAQGCSTDATTQFTREFQAGADCPRLFELRNIAKREASAPLQEEMNDQLRSVQCFSSTSKRGAAVPPKAGSFTVQDYRIYREFISSPSSVPEAQALDNVAREHGISPSAVRGISKHVSEELSRNNWIASPAAEIRHASDWNGETQE